MGLGINSAMMSQAMYEKDIHSVPKINKTDNDAELRKQTDAFEAVIVKMMMDEAMKDTKNIFSSQNDPGDKIYKSMYRDELSRASAGSFGFSQMLYDFLTQKQGKMG